MESLILNRFASEHKQTLGEFVFHGEVLCKTIELPWKDNRKGQSCIPRGQYRVIRRWSPKYGEHFHILDVPNRNYILIHAANYSRQLLGCIGVGQDHKDIDKDGLRDVTSSRATMKMLLATLPIESFQLIIV